MVAPPRVYERRTSRPSPVILLTTCTGTPSEVAVITPSAAALSNSPTLSLLVSTTTGRAPESKAKTNSRSNRRWFGGVSKPCVRNTTSILAAMVWDSKRIPSAEARRTNCDFRGTTPTIRSQSGVTTIQSPTATSAPMFRTRRSCSELFSTAETSGTQRNVLHPRSIRFTRPMSWSSLVAIESCIARSKDLFQPRSLKALRTMTFTLLSWNFRFQVLDCPTSMSYNGILLHVTTTRHR